MIGDVFGDFIQNLPPGLIGMMCTPGILFLVMVGIMIFRRRMLAKQRETAAATSSGFVEYTASQPPEEPAIDDPAMGDMPDLDLLIMDADPEPLPLPVVPAPPMRKIPEGVQQVSLNTGATAEAREIITVLRDERDGRLMVQLGGTTYRTLVDAPDAKKQFVKIMKELSGVVIKPDESAAQPDAEVKPDPATPEPEAAGEQEPVSLGSLMQPAEEQQITEKPVQQGEKPASSIKSQTPPPAAADGSMPGDLPSFRLADNEPDVKRSGLFGRRTKVEHKPVPTVNIADAIEAYLQYKLRHTPEYDGPQLHVRSSPDGGVRIQVGETFYEAVSDVEDPSIRDFLQATIQEWQSRH